MPPATTEPRAAELSAALGELDCQALLVVAESAGDPDLAAWLAVPAHLGASVLVAPRDGPARLAYLTDMERDEAAATGLPLITPQDLEILRALREAPQAHDYLAWVMAHALAAAGVAPGRVALAGRMPAGEISAACAALAAQGWVWVPGNSLMRQVRKRKTATELAAIRQAAAATVTAQRAVAAALAAATGKPPQGGLPEAGGELWLGGERLTIGRLRGAASAVFAAHGMEQPRGNIVAAGDQGGVPHSAGDDARVVRAGEPVVVDLYPRTAGRGYAPLFADCTRTLCAGTPPAEVVRAHAAVLAALAVARAMVAPGARGWDLQEAVCRQLEAEGYATPLNHPGTVTGYVHNLGHGVGFELHELPSFRRDTGAEGVLRLGDAITLEPGLYDAAAGYGVRLEDLFLVAADGPELLTPLPYDLDPRAWGEADAGT
jgi:Xaa-Pro aminopeptidase